MEVKVCAGGEVVKIEIEVKDPMVVRVGVSETTVDVLLELICALAEPIPSRWYRFYREGERTMVEVRQGVEPS